MIPSVEGPKHWKSEKTRKHNHDYNYNYNYSYDYNYDYNRDSRSRNRIDHIVEIVRKTTIKLTRDDYRNGRKSQGFQRPEL